MNRHTNCITSLKSHRTPLLHIIVKTPPIVLRYLSDDALHALSYIFNLSLHQGKFPDAFKKTKIVPIFKKGDSKNLSNYRPISLLSSFSKLLKKLCIKDCTTS